MADFHTLSSAALQLLFENVSLHVSSLHSVSPLSMSSCKFNSLFKIYDLIISTVGIIVMVLKNILHYILTYIR